MTSIITVEKVPIPIFGKEEVDKITYTTKTLQLNAVFAAKGCAEVWQTTKFANWSAAFASKGCAEVWQTTKFADLPATKDAANTNKEC